MSKDSKIIINLDEADYESIILIKNGIKYKTLMVEQIEQIISIFEKQNEFSKIIEKKWANKEYPNGHHSAEEDYEELDCFSYAIVNLLSEFYKDKE